MTGLDTNVLVRYLTQDHPRQARKASQVIEDATSNDEMLFIGNIVICELVWVLESAYGYGRGSIAAVLESMLRTRQFAFEAKDALWRALDDYRSGKGDLSDYLLGRTARLAGCAKTLTFDKSLKASDLFEVL